MGDIASQLVCNSIKNMFDNAKKINKAFLPTAFAVAEKDLLKKQIDLDAQSKMKTTATAMVINGNKVFISHIGDTRLYLFRKRKIVFRTLDHSIPQMLCLAGEITENEIRYHPDRNSLMKVMGVDEEIKSENQKPIRIKKNDAFLLCSDGFWELIEDDTMCELLEQSCSVQEWLDKMSRCVLENGKGKNMDNNTAIAVWVR